jgi:hypothetical protein
MSGLLIGTVLFAAVLHAGLNAIAKSIPDRLVASALIGVAFAVCRAIGVLLLAMPASSAWPFVMASSALQVGYTLLLTGAYPHGEFGRGYPLARGLSGAGDRRRGDGARRAVECHRTARRRAVVLCVGHVGAGQCLSRIPVSSSGGSFSSVGHCSTGNGWSFVV